MKNHLLHIWVACFAIGAGLYARMRAKLEQLVPVGYQDETGFHRKD